MSAPKHFIIFILSFDAFELTARIHLYPFRSETMARLKPVFPDVVSIIVLPFLSMFFFSA